MNTITKNEEDFFVSYNPLTDVGPETALVHRIDGSKKFYILLGDYTKEYSNIKDKSFISHKKLFDKLLKRGAKESPWSD